VPEITVYDLPSITNTSTSIGDIPEAYTTSIRVAPLQLQGAM
jgi:hypothetical protein